MERPTGLGKSLEDVFDLLAPVEPDASARTHALFGFVSDDLSTDDRSTPTKNKQAKLAKQAKQAGKNKKSKTKKSANSTSKKKHKQKSKKKGRRA